MSLDTEYILQLNSTNNILNLINTYNDGFGIYAQGANTSVTNANTFYNTNEGIFTSGATTALSNIVSYLNTTDGIYCSGDGSTISNIKSYKNGNYGYKVNANLVQRIWQSGITDSLNGYRSNWYNRRQLCSNF